MSRKFTILGKSGSGKTCYLLAMYRKLRRGVAGYSISAQDDTLNKELSDMFNRLNNGQDQSRFPQTTDYVETYPFNLNYASRKIESFDWIDYPGRITVDITDEKYEQVVKTIEESSMLFICVDGELLRSDDTKKTIEDKIEAIQDECAYDLNDFFAKYVEANNKLPPIGIILTKSDLFMHDTNEEEIRVILQEAFSPLFVAKNIRIGVISVTLGENIQDDNYSGEVDPVNIHLPIFMGIWCALNDRIKEYTDKLAANRSSTSDLQGKISDKNSRINSLTQNVSNLKQNINNLTQNINSMDLCYARRAGQFLLVA